MEKTHRFSHQLLQIFPHPALTPVDRTKYSFKFYKFVNSVALGSWKENHQLMEPALYAERKQMG